MSSNSAQVEDDYFNDLSRQPDLRTTVNKKPSPNSDSATAQAGQIKQKRVACVICRKRKLKCDGERPSCGTCSRLNHNCAYDEVRRKSGPKRGYVKELEARLGAILTRESLVEANMGRTQLKSRLSSRGTMPVLQQPQRPISPLYLPRTLRAQRPIRHSKLVP